MKAHIHPHWLGDDQNRHPRRRYFGDYGPGLQVVGREINDAGGILLKTYGKRMPIEVLECDDCPSTEEAMRTSERQISLDKVGILLPLCSTGFNLAMGPTCEKYKYPLLATTSVNYQLSRSFS